MTRAITTVKLGILASALRDLSKRVKILPFAGDVPEEAIALRPQHYVHPAKWGVAVIESWSKTKGKTGSKHIWDEMIHFANHERASVNLRFRYFMDGIQRTTPIGQVRIRKNSFETVPIHLAQIGVALLRRDRHTLKPAVEEARLLLEFPSAFVRSETNISELKTDILAEIAHKAGKSLQTVDTSFRVAKLKESEAHDMKDVVELDGIKYPRIPTDELWNWCTDPAQFRSQARRWTTRYRDIVEQHLYDKALQRAQATADPAHYDFVVKDGSLTHARGEVVKRALGVIKNFGTIFLDRSQMVKVLGLPYGYRSPVFTKTRPEGDPDESDIYDPEAPGRKLKLVSWYVRIRPVEHHDPLWGLLRVEMHVDSLASQGHIGRWNEKDTDLIDAVSQQLALEASPTSQPDPRWSNLLYPIRCCERYLRSRALPHTTARFLLGGS
ncbi:MAG: hypothetical protein WBF13_09145 [Candidatus Zixiibacteriota bacterium]